MHLKEVLAARGFDVTSRTKLFRHQDAKFDLVGLKRDGHLEHYQALQTTEVLARCTHVLSFMACRARHATFHGAYRVDGVEPLRADHHRREFPHPEMYATAKYHYRLEALDGYDDLVDRLVIDWGTGTRSWAQLLGSKQRDVIELLPVGYVGSFPGYQRIVIAHRDLQTVIKNPEANRIWHRMLREIAGVYLIQDRSTGRQYVGSGYGEQGILGRWKQYAKNGHGGNEQLVHLAKRDPEHASKHFTFSILATLPRTLPSREVIAVEKLWKDKLGSRAHGLNSN